MKESEAERAGQEATRGTPRRPLELGLANEEGYPHTGQLDYADPEVDASTGTVLLRGVFPNPHPVRLIPGLFVRVRLAVRQHEDALLVSERALGQDQSGSYVLVVGDDDVVEHRSVKLGAAREGMRVVRSGLEPDDRVILEGLLRARPGAKVTPQPGGRAPGPVDVAAPEAPGDGG
jgi:membrane fusion protein (multidrug efflux system)